MYHCFQWQLYPCHKSLASKVWHSTHANFTWGLAVLGQVPIFLVPSFPEPLSLYRFFLHSHLLHNSHVSRYFSIAQTKKYVDVMNLEDTEEIDQTAGQTIKDIHNIPFNNYSQSVVSDSKTYMIYFGYVSIYLYNITQSVNRYAH